MSSIAQRLIKAAGKETLAASMATSNFGDKKVITKTPIPALNILMGGSLDGGITSGITQIVGDSRTFKTNLCLAAVKAFLDADPEAVCVFFDCEFGAKKSMETLGIDLSRIIHVPFEDLEDLKFQLTRMLDETKYGDKVIFFIDSISQVASKKEAQNAIDGNEAADLTRAREMNSFFRIITPKLNLRNIPLFAINSYYESISNKYAEVNIKGGKQQFLSSDAIWFVTRSQEKDGDKEFIGWNFNYSILKSRHVKEKAKITITVTYDGGIYYYSSLFELARDGGFIDMPTSGWYTRTSLCGIKDETKYRKADTDNPDFWDQILSAPAFRKFIEDTYSIQNQTLELNKGEEVDQETGEIKKL